MEGLKSAETDRKVLAWRTASLMKQRRIPSLMMYLKPVSRNPSKEEKALRQAEHDALRNLMER